MDKIFLQTTVERYQLDAFDIMLFEKLREKERLQMNQPEVKIKVNQNELEISGPPELVSSCVKEIENWHSQTCYFLGICKHFQFVYLYMYCIETTNTLLMDKIFHISSGFRNR
jgi:hypothetical protein